MPVRLRITALFTLLVMIILILISGGIYYFSHVARAESIKLRLYNRAVTTARLLGQREIFDEKLVQRIDSLTTISLKNKVVLAFDNQNRKIYSYSDLPGDTIRIDEDIFDEVREKGSVFYLSGEKEAIALYYTDPNIQLVLVSAAEDSDGRQYLRNLFHILLSSFLVGIALVLIGGFLFSGRLLLPVKKIADEVDEISAQNLSRRLATSTAKDEWSNLTSTLNKLLNRLQESFEMQRRFISNASHELSTPLTAISSQVEVSLQRDRDADYYRRVMKSIHDDARKMNKLVQTLLEFAKASGNAGGLEIKPIRIDEIILRLPADLASRNQGHSVYLEFDKLPDNEDELVIFGNETLLFTAISNIVTNACKYSQDHQSIVRLETSDEYVTVAVSDNGVGIAADDLSHVFEPFYRVNEKAEGTGFGLGLSLSERIIRLHKGHITVSSIVGEGTTFKITLPSVRRLRHFSQT
jgi:signal transduction histidine kinase